MKVKVVLFPRRKIEHHSDGRQQIPVNTAGTNTTRFINEVILTVTRFGSGQKI